MLLEESEYRLLPNFSPSSFPQNRVEGDPKKKECRCPEKVMFKVSQLKFPTLQIQLCVFTNCTSLESAWAAKIQTVVPGCQELNCNGGLGRGCTWLWAIEGEPKASATSTSGRKMCLAPREFL